MTFLTNKLGSSGEDHAIVFLVGKGFIIIERNYRFGKGEIDIIAKEKEVLVFVEVKTRNNDNYGDPVYAITKSKKNQIIRTAQGYLYERFISDQECRFDVITINFDEQGEPIITHYEHAFIKE